MPTRSKTPGTSSPPVSRSRRSTSDSWSSSTDLDPRSSDTRTPRRRVCNGGKEEGGSRELWKSKTETEVGEGVNRTREEKECGFPFGKGEGREKEKGESKHREEIPLPGAVADQQDERSL